MGRSIILDKYAWPVIFGFPVVAMIILMLLVSFMRPLPPARGPATVAPGTTQPATQAAEPGGCVRRR